MSFIFVCFCNTVDGIIIVTLVENRYQKEQTSENSATKASSTEWRASRAIFASLFWRLFEFVAIFGKYFHKYFAIFFPSTVLSEETFEKMETLVFSTQARSLRSRSIFSHFWLDRLPGLGAKKEKLKSVHPSCWTPRPCIRRTPLKVILTRAGVVGL